MRLFIAINLNDDFKSTLTSMQDDLRSQHVG
jgi:2'-5' RNA ligase